MIAGEKGLFSSVCDHWWDAPVPVSNSLPMLTQATLTRLSGNEKGKSIIYMDEVIEEVILIIKKKYKVLKYLAFFIENIFFT